MIRKVRRKRLHIRQSLAFREGKHPCGKWYVGYWESNNHADQDFRSFGGYFTEMEAIEFAEKIVQERPREFVF